MNRSVRAGVRFQTARRYPAAATRRAINAPMSPKPRKATRVLAASALFDVVVSVMPKT
jgi:hypothetical protein